MDHDKITQVDFVYKIYIRRHRNINNNVVNKNINIFII